MLNRVVEYPRPNAAIPICDHRVSLTRTIVRFVREERSLVLAFATGGLAKPRAQTEPCAQSKPCAHSKPCALSKPCAARAAEAACVVEAARGAALVKAPRGAGGWLAPAIGATEAGEGLAWTLVLALATLCISRGAAALAR